MASAPEIKALTCSVCLEILRDPRLLQCHHTFCTKCIQDVADHHRGRLFPCPSCRHRTELPRSGASALQKNFYIKEADLVRAQQGLFHCQTHTDQWLDMYCHDCQKIVCLKCDMMKHKKHNTQDLTESITSAESQLKLDRIRLDTVSSQIDRKIRAKKEELQALQGEKEALEKNIRSRHAAVVAALEMSLKKALNSLNETCVQVEKSLKTDLVKEHQNKKHLQHLQKKVRENLERETDFNVIPLAKEMRDGHGSETAVSELMQQRTNVRPVFRCSALTAKDIAKHLQDYLGRLDNVEVKAEETTVERFNIPEDPGTEVFSMCVTHKGSLKMSYGWRNFSTEAHAEEFDSTGSHTRTVETAKGKASFKSTERLLMQYTQHEGRFITNSKSKEDFSLHNDLTSGEAIVKKTIVKSEVPFKTEDKEEFTIQCGPHRAFDVDSTGQHFVVVEGSKASDSDRNVRLFNRPRVGTSARESREGSVASRSGLHTAAKATYSPPCQAFNPSDVCFYKKGGREVLLVADVMNDAIHVVHVHHDGLEFVCFLCAGHPLLVKPTALTVDSRNRVWVACGGRIILVVEPDLPTF
ncbi:tripartite motif-containing protein 5-like [Littorina saxatilis]|uniref:Tripartite motif-containing protein 3-like n=1 Tax=Littorina saxatilis TaxID=31220 RepID=A0AAN9BJV1_9CAEN